MSRAERLIFLIDLIHRRKVVTIPDITRITGVSSRTAFRDIASLSRMNIPIYFDDGYRIAPDSKVHPADFSPSDIELVRFCLRFNPLSQYAYFSRHCRSIERRLIDFLGCEDRDPVRPLVATDSRPGLTSEERNLRLEEQFLRALVERRKIAVDFASKDAGPAEVFPEQLLRTRESTLLAVRRAGDKDPEWIPLRTVRAIRILGEASCRCPARSAGAKRSTQIKGLTEAG